MTYCMFENTAGELSQVLEAMYEAIEIDDLDLGYHEQEGFRELYMLCKEYIKEYQRLAEEFIEDEV